MSETFATRLLSWFHQHGRKNLPWQQDPSPYRVWVSEIMLQQTRVETVLFYFERFMQHFPDIASLAAAKQDDVLHLWSGLGYYARARNLHKAAQMIVIDYAGEFPGEFEQVLELPGIGRSTAAAILSLSQNQHHAILDGNVKRVLARHHALAGWPGSSKVEKQLWTIAEQNTPRQECAAYTQAIMDLGATLCTRKQPRCTECPVNDDCQAFAAGLQHDLPHAKPKKQTPTRHRTVLILNGQNQDLLMQRRPNQGIWGGLWSFPEFESSEDAMRWCEQRFGKTPSSAEELTALAHTFSHFHLILHPIKVSYPTPIHWVMEGDDWVWYKHGTSRAGLAAPVKKLLDQILN
jgi:A/G-specific adenine glycosylase